MMVGKCWTLKTEHLDRTRMMLGSGGTKDEYQQNRKALGNNGSISQASWIPRSSSITMAVNPLSQPYSWTFRRVVWATLVLISVILGFWLFYRFNQVIFTLFIAIVIGTVIRPAVAWLNRRGLPQPVGVIFVYLMLFLLLAGFLLLLFPLISEQSTTIAAVMPEYYQNLRQWVVTHPNQFLASLSEFLPAALPNLRLRPVQQTGPEML